jgi:hypothetical protein
MSPATRLALAALSLFLLAMPIGVPKPGLPQTLKADEPAYYMQAQSLAFDRDARCEARDLRRLFAEFPYAPANNVVLTTDDGWRTVFYGKPFLYPLFAAPFVAVWGANGMVLANMLLFVAMIWMGAVHLRRFNADGLAALFAALYFLASVAFSYVFWLQPEVFNMASVMAALFVGLEAMGERDTAWRRRLGWLRSWAPALSGALLALGVFNKPMLLAFALPVWVQGWSLGGGARGLLRAFLRWCAGFATVMALAAGGSYWLIGHASPYLGGERAGLSVLGQQEVPRVASSSALAPLAPVPAKGGAAVAASPGAASANAAAPAQPRRTWWWILRVPQVPLGEFLEDLRYFFVGRHTGLVLYLPFALLAALLFAWSRPRDAVRWATLAAAVAFVLFVQLFIPFNWHGGGGFVGNRYFVNAYPALLFLVTAVAPRWLLPLAAGWAGLALGTLILSPFGRPVPFPTLQAHVRGSVFARFPLELSLKELPGYWHGPLGGLAGLAPVVRRDLVIDRGDTLWLHGATPIEIWLQSERPIEDLVLALRVPSPQDRVRLRFGRQRQEVNFEPGHDDAWRRVTLRPGEPDRVRRRGGRQLFAYRLEIATGSGEVRHWTAEYPPPKSDTFAHNRTSEESFFVGAEALFLGGTADLAAPLFAASWEACDIPASVPAGSAFSVPVRLRNRSPVVWPAAGAASVRLAYHWRSGRSPALTLWEGGRTALAEDLQPGATVEIPVRIEAPATPGAWELSIDPLREHVGWFSERGVEPCRRRVLVESPPLPPPPAPPAEGERAAPR